jgi:hypothetical protein
MKFLTYIVLLIAVLAVNTRLSHKDNPKKGGKGKGKGKGKKKNKREKGWFTSLLKAGSDFIEDNFGNSTWAKVVTGVADIALDALNDTAKNSTETAATSF